MTNLIITTIVIAAIAGAAGMLLSLVLYLGRSDRRKGLYDYTYCECGVEVAKTLAAINDMGGKLIGVTQQDGLWTIFFWRPADG